MDYKVKCKNNAIKLAYKGLYWDQKNCLSKSNYMNQKEKINSLDHIKNLNAYMSKITLQITKWYRSMKKIFVLSERQYTSILNIQIILTGQLERL